MDTVSAIFCPLAEELLGKLKATSRIVINDPRMKDMSSHQILPSEVTVDALNPPP